MSLFGASEKFMKDTRTALGALNHGNAVEKSFSALGRVGRKGRSAEEIMKAGRSRAIRGGIGASALGLYHHTTRGTRYKSRYGSRGQYGGGL